MAAKNDVIHRSSRALVILDMFNPFDFERADQLLKNTKPIAAKIAGLRARAKKARVPVIYVNDNFDHWRSDWTAITSHCLRKGSRSEPVAKLLIPDSDDYFVLKPKYSVFYLTCLEQLLEDIGAKEIILTGIAADICILFTVHDASVRNFKVTVPRDCVAAETTKQKRNALELMKKAFKAKTPESAAVRF